MERQPPESGATRTPSRKRRGQGRKRILFAVIVLIAAAIVLYFLQREEPQTEASEPLIVTVGTGDVENTIAATGTLKPGETVDIGAQVSGQLEELHVRAGEQVEAGQLLAEIDASQLLNRVEASRASLEGQQAQLVSRRSSLALAEANLDRQRRLLEQNATSQQDFETARDQVESARSSLTQLQKQIEQSEASLAIDERELEFTQVRAPISGTVTSLPMSEGQTLNASQSAPIILTLADLSVMEVQTQISEADVSRLEPGMDVYFTTLGGGDRRWRSTLEQILPQPTIDNNVVLYTGEFRIDNADRALLPEMTAQVYFITSAERDVLTVPLGALNQQDDGRITVQRVNGDGSISEQEITIGLTSRTNAEVLSGLQEGDRVVAGVTTTGSPEGVDFRAMRRGGGFGGF